MATTTMPKRAQSRNHSATGQKPKVDWKEVLTSTFKEYSQDDLAGLAAESAFHILLSLFPLAIFGAAVSGIINVAFPGLNLFNNIIGAVYAGLPTEAANTIKPVLEGVLKNQSGGLLSFGLVTALWSGSAAMSTFVKSLNRAYDVEETRPIWQRKGLEIGLTIFLGIVLAVAFTSIAFGGPLIDSLAKLLHLGPVGRFIAAAVRLVAVVLFVIGALSFLYWIGPNVKQKFTFITAGSIVAAVVLLLFIAVFGIYVSRFGGANSYAKTYGTLGGIIVLLLVFNYSSLIVMIGGELNSELAKRYDATAIKDIAESPEKDKGETIYGEKAPGKKPAERESDLKGAQSRGDAYKDTAAATRNASTKAHATREEINDAVNDADSSSISTTAARVEGQGDSDGDGNDKGNGKRKIVNYGTGKREAPPHKDDPTYRQVATGSRTPTLTDGAPPSKNGVIGVGILAAGAIGMVARKIKGGDVD